MGPASNPEKQKPLLAESIRGRTSITPTNAFIYISVTMGNDNFSSGSI